MSDQQHGPGHPTDEQIRLALHAAGMVRESILSALGLSYDGTRDIYRTLGYTRTPAYDHYAAHFARNPIANRIVRAYPEAAWSLPPEIRSSEDPSEADDFTEAIAELDRNLGLFAALRTADTLSGVGQYAVLLLGLSDGTTASAPTGRAGTQLLYMMPFSQANVVSVLFDEDPTSPRYGLPTEYSLRIGTAFGESPAGRQIVAHWQRCIHLAPGKTESRVYGTPRLEAVLNRLDDLEKIYGGSAEAFWRGVAMRYHADVRDGFQSSAQTDAAIKDQLQAMIHNMGDMITTRGTTLSQLAPAVVSPSDHVDIIFQAISAQTGIPKRILTGSERGELASSQDREEWLAGKVAGYQTTYAEPEVLRPTIDRLIGLGVLPEPAGGQYVVVWPTLADRSEADSATVGETKTRALVAYAGQPVAEDVLPRSIFRREILGLSDETLAEIEAAEAEAEAIDEASAQEAADAFAQGNKGSNEGEG